MLNRYIPVTGEDIEAISQTIPTPFYLYDEASIRHTAQHMNQCFDWVEGGYRNYFAVKALPNPHVLRILAQEGMGFDCSSMSELLLVEKLGISDESIMFTSNNTPAKEFQKAIDLGAIINLDDISHIDYLHKHCGMPNLICFRYNPGHLKSGNAIIGTPEEAKYGLTREQLLEGYRRARKLGAQRFALHTMVASNELNPEYFIETAKILFELVIELWEKTGIKIEFVNLGGGIGIPYRPDQEAIDLKQLSAKLEKLYANTIQKAQLGPIKIVSENGRYVTGQHGYLITRVIHEKNTYKNFIGTDACMANLMRPGMYGAYHHISVLGKEGSETRQKYDVTGSLCENNDKFAINRVLPKITIGDILVIHDVGAHGHAMGFNYNGKLRSAELLLHPNSSVSCIRRAETYDDLFATLEFVGSKGC